MTVAGTCDLFNPGERLNVRFYTRGRQFAEPEPQARAVARAENLPPLVRCHWPDREDEPLLPVEADYQLVRRGAVLFALAHQLAPLAKLIGVFAGRLAHKRVFRDRND